MAHGENHAKQIITNRMLRNAGKLRNGSAGDIEVIGNTLADVAEVTATMFEQDFRTVGDCDDRHKKIATRRTSRIKVGPVEFEGQITSAVIHNGIPILCLIGVIALIGKDLGWW